MTDESALLTKVPWWSKDTDSHRDFLELDGSIGPSNDELRRIAAQNPPPADWYDMVEERPF